MLHRFSFWCRVKNTLACLYLFKPIRITQGGTKLRMQRWWHCEKEVLAKEKVTAASLCRLAV